MTGCCFHAGHFHVQIYDVGLHVHEMWLVGCFAHHALPCLLGCNPLAGKEVSAELLGVSALPMKALKFSVDWTPVLGPLLATWILQLLLPVL